MTSFASLAGHRVISASLVVPSNGCHHADVVLADAVVLSGPVTLVVGDLTAECTVRRGGPWEGSSRYRLVGGADGWAKTVPRRGYHHDEGVRLRALLEDAAGECGESVVVDDAADRSVGVHWAREAAPAARLLRELAGAAWWVGLDGVTRVGVRSAGKSSGRFDVIRFDAQSGRAVLAAEELAQFAPGLSLGVGGAADIVASTVRYVVESDKARVEVWSASGEGTEEDRTTRAIRSFVREALPALTYSTLHRYRVHAQDGDLLDLESDDPLMPDLAAVPVRPGVAGVSATLPTGSVVVVAFENGDPGRPFACAHEVAGAGGFAPSAASWDVSGDLSLRAGVTGTPAAEHATSAEAMVNFVVQALVAAGAAAVIPFSWASPAALGTAIVTAINATNATPVDALAAGASAALAGALAAKLPDPTGLLPGPGWPGVRGG